MISELEPVDRASLEAVVERAKIASSSQLSQHGELSSFDAAIQKFRNLVVFALANNANTLLGFDSQVRAVDASLDAIIDNPGAPDRLLPHVEKLQEELKPISDHAVNLSQEQTIKS